MQERWATQPRNRVWKVESADSTGFSGTSCLVEEDMISFNDVLTLVSAMNVQYGVSRPAMVSAFGPSDDRGRRARYRWAWERLTTWGRVSDVLLVHVVSWGD